MMLSAMRLEFRTELIALPQVPAVPSGAAKAVVHRCQVPGVRCQGPGREFLRLLIRPASILPTSAV